MIVEVIKFCEIPDFEEYVSHFNETFSRNMSVAEYRAFYEDESVDTPADVVVVRTEDGVILSAAIVSYQRINMGGKIKLVGVMGGAWTVPAYRGCGHMRKMISCVVKHLAERDIAYMCGFGLIDNVSCRFEKGAGAYIQPVWYLNGGNVGEETFPLVSELPREHFAKAFEKFHGDFAYTLGQFKLRYGFYRNARLLKIGDSDIAIIEESPFSTNVNFISSNSADEFAKSLGAIIKWAQTNKLRKIFAYVSTPELMDACRKYSFDIKDGYFSILATKPEYKASYALNIMMGDRT